MTINGELSRRQFLSGSGTLVIGEALLSMAPASAAEDVGQLQPGSPGAVTKSPAFIRNCKRVTSGTRCWTTLSGRM